MNLGIEGKRALVTGAGRGIGRAAALALAREGVKVAVVSRTAVDIRSLVDGMGGESRGHWGAAMDLSPEGAPVELMKRLEKADFGPVDIVVHNLGGTLGITDPFCPIADWRRVWRLNAEVGIELNSLLLPGMQKRGWGRVVMVSSISSMENHGPVPYCSTKAALTAYARSMARFLAPSGVVMTAVLPGAVLTEKGYWDTASRENPEHVRKFLADRMAIHRFGKPEEIGEAIAFLCSEHSSFFVGSIVPIDGGHGRGFFGM
jgi:NAD(P)-dependent dehydrogenase (short-subunit alcohol dehydrogenase family)